MYLGWYMYICFVHFKSGIVFQFMNAERFTYLIHILWNFQFINCQQELDTSFCTRWDSLYLVSQSVILKLAETT